MNLSRLFLFGVLFFSVNCIAGDYVLRDEHDRRVSTLETSIEEVRLCMQTRHAYVQRGQTCLYGLWSEDFGVVIRSLEEDKIERGSASYEEEFDRRCADLKKEYCHYSCYYEAICYEPSTPVCNSIGVDPNRWRDDHYERSRSVEETK